MMKFNFICDVAETVFLKLVVNKECNSLFIKYRLADTVGAKKLSANWRCPTFRKIFNIDCNLENK